MNEEDEIPKKQTPNGNSAAFDMPSSNNGKMQSQEKPKVPPSEIMANLARRKSMPTPLPMLTPINDPIELYCLSMVDSLRNMPRSERERVKYEFAKILKDAKYKDQT